MLPEQFTNRMKELLKEEYEDFAACYGNDHAHSLRINPLKGTKERYDQTSVFKQREPLKEQVAWEENGFYYEDSLQPGKHPFHEAGVYYIQEASAMAPAAICKRADPDFVNSEDAGKIRTEKDTEGQREKKSSDDFRFFGERILDLCAAPGGKSTQMAAAMAGRGILFSNEIHPARARILSENIERMGIVNDIVLNHDPKVLAERFPSYFHRILVDAPCSGEGMFRKNEEAVEQWSLENVKLCAGRQEEILECAYTMLMGGGILVYSTCTFAPEEDEEMIAHFLAKHPDMKLLPVPLAGGMEPGLVRQEALMKLLQNQGQSKRETTYDMEERFRNLDYQNWKPVRTLGGDSYGTVYEIARDDGFGMVDHAALKVLSIPAAPEDFDALVAEGRTPEEVTALFHRQVETIARQLMAVDAISDEPNLLRCEDHVIRAHADGRGWDIYVRTELLPSLPDYLRNHPHGEADIIRLGAGLCSALETCHRRGIVHGDIKPRNVFVGGGNFNEQVTYKLGDFGMAQFSAVDNTNDFMAPAVLCVAPVSIPWAWCSTGRSTSGASRSCRCRRRRWRPPTSPSRASSACAVTRCPNRCTAARR